MWTQTPEAKSPAWDTAFETGDRDEKVERPGEEQVHKEDSTLLSGELKGEDTVSSFL